MKNFDYIRSKLENVDEVIYRLVADDVAAVSAEALMHEGVDAQDLTDEHIHHIYERAIDCLDTQDEFPGYWPLFYGALEGYREFIKESQ